jgi:serine/threonine protein kinase
LGPALIFEFDPLSIRLDHFIAQTKGSLTADTKLGLIRQIAEVVRFAHEKKVVHRALSPQSILVTNPESSVPRIKVFNWQAGFRDGGSSSATGHGVSGTSHVERLVEDASTAYMAPEAISDPDSSGEHLDIFSLGAIAYHIFTGQPPAANGLELGNLLRETKGLQISSVLNGAGENLQFLIQFSTHPEVLSRIDSVPDFLDCLDQVEDELTTPENKYVEDPTRAQKGDVLPGNFIVEKRLGQGACSVALLVKRGDEEFCLKAASTPEHNSRLKNEAEVLQKLRHQHIVEYCDTLQIGERTCILMRQAGKETLGQRLRKEGRLHIDLLQRFGEDLIEIVKYLEEQGIPHRDIKPDNIGVGPVGRGDKLHIILFDFSLSRALPDNIRAGTKGYLDPLLSLRKPPLWDLHAERYAAAATLYELTTGSLPTWGDEKSDPSQLNCEATIHPESFDANLRDGLTKFFQKAFRRDPSKRFDNAEVMLRDWRQCFEGIEKPGSLSDHENVEELRGLLAQATFETAIHELGLGTRATNALDRSNILTVKDLLLAPTKKLHKLRGVGNKTRREIIAAYRILQERLGLPPKGPIIRAEKESEAEITPQDQANLSIDLLAQRITRVGSREESSTHRVLMALLGLDPEFTNTWPSQSDVARYLGVTRARIGQQCATFQERWGKQPSLTPLRTEIADSLKAFGGVMTLGELAETLLVARGSVEDEPRRTQLAAAVIRAAVEVERSKDEPRFLVRRNEIHVLIALAPEMADYALQLGKEADILAAEDPLAAPTRTLQRLREIQLPPQAVPLSESRLIRLAAAASQTAAVSSRQELYPRGMDAARALRLSQGALLGVPALTVADIRERVIGRYPQAAPLPDRPELDALLRLIGLDSEWDSTVKGGSYVTRSQTTRTITSTSRPPSRFATSLGPFEFEDITPDIAAARQFEEKLQRAIREGSFLALLTPPKYYKQACDELLRRFPVELADFEGLFIDALREVAQSLKVNWDLVLQTDAAPGRCDWDKLLMLVRRAMPLVEKNLASTQKTVLMTYAGMLARYDQMDLLERLRDRVGRRDGISGLWLLIPGDQQALLEGKAIPILAAGQRARIPDSWLRNEHRANGSKVTSFEAQNP